MTKHYPISAKIVLWAVFGIFAIYALTLLFPFVWMLINSFKTNKDFFYNVWSLPTQFRIENYFNVFNYQMFAGNSSYNILSMFFNSIIITISATIINTLLSTSAAYVIAKYRFVGRNILYALALFTLILPVVGTLPSQYRLMQNLQLNNTIPGILVLYSGSFGFTFFIMHGYFKNVSPTYGEAAFVDGASDFQVFIKIMIPMARPIMISMAIIYSIGIWNDYITPSIYLKDFPTLAVGIKYLTTSMNSQGAFAEMFAALIISIIPILVLFIIFRKTIMENTIAGGLKG